MSKKTEVATIDPQNTAMAAWGDTGATGFEGADSSELKIPFINLLQSNSAEVEEGRAKAGQFFNNVMGDVVDDLVIIPCARQRVFVEWVPIDDGGGLVAVHEPDSQFVVRAIAENGGSTHDIKVADGKHDLVETVYLYCLVLDADGGYQRAVISFSSSKLGRYREFFTKASTQQIMVGERRVTLPMWAHRYRVTSDDQISKRNSKKFKNILLSFDGETSAAARLSPTDQLALAGKEFHDMIAAGEATADLSTADKAEPDAGNIPF